MCTVSFRVQLELPPSQCFPCRPKVVVRFTGAGWLSVVAPFFIWTPGWTRRLGGRSQRFLPR